jgi:hypothetical protein
MSDPIEGNLPIYLNKIICSDMRVAQNEKSED